MQQLIASEDSEMTTAAKITSTNQLGDAVRQRRKAARLTQAATAQLARVGNRFLSELERGKSTVEFGKTLQVLNVLGLELHLASRTGVAGS